MEYEGDVSEGKFAVFDIFAEKPKISNALARNAFGVLLAPHRPYFKCISIVFLTLLC